VAAIGSYQAVVHWALLLWPASRGILPDRTLDFAGKQKPRTCTRPGARRLRSVKISR
jgi:hypothetical protein